MAENYLLYATIVLFIMGFSNLALFILFRLKHQKIHNLPRNLSVTVFDKTFNIMEIEKGKRRIFHRFLELIPIFLMAFSWWLVPLMLGKIFQYDILLSLILLLACLHLMLLDHASETYQDANLIIEACYSQAKLGVGDIKFLKLLEKGMPRLSNYYLALSVLFLTLAVTLKHVLSLFLWLFAELLGLIFEVSSPTGIVKFEVVVILFFSVVAIIMFVTRKIRTKLLLIYDTRHKIEPGSQKCINCCVWL